MVTEKIEKPAFKLGIGLVQSVRTHKSLKDEYEFNTNDVLIKQQLFDYIYKVYVNNRVSDKNHLKHMPKEFLLFMADNGYFNDYNVDDRFWLQEQTGLESIFPQEAKDLFIF